MRKTPVLERLMGKVIPEPNSGCWLWMGVLGPNGYGRIAVSGRTVQAHREMFKAHGGTLDNSRQLDHLCRVRCCVNPLHLEKVTCRENLRRGKGHGSETACPQGHPYSAENTYVSPDGDRRCRICARAHFRKWYRKGGAA